MNSPLIRTIKRQPHWAIALVLILVAAVYWGLIATDRYVSKAHIVLESPEVNMSSMNISSLLSGTQGSGDLLLLRDHLLSVTMLKKLQRDLDLRSHYSQDFIDPWSRLDSADVPIEKFHEYIRSHMSIEFDEYSAILKIQVQAYDRKMSQTIVQVLLDEGEQHMNRMGQRLAEEQVEFIDQQAKQAEERLFAAREKMLQFQNENGLVSPTQTVQAIFTTVSQLQAQIAALEARKKALLDYQSETSPEVMRLSREIRSLEQQTQLEQDKMASQTGTALNETSAEFETLQLRAEFALQLYTNTLTALESTRIEAARKLKQISILEFPTLPEYSTKPDRTYNFMVFLLFTVFITAIIHLARAIVRDHKH
ncbi:chain-length determining protein [Idiomarina piscisalsi]|uniref:Chain-length determining protein n=1 Tax=Idiomarina piscisalsi TaxID=1096243 RepID=A0A432YRZ2_9GAMM|nr:chain-length determining protein [Idiomarina piscisalsi]RUO64299.1 chain-length determining protein [Idiomarina piscisalsi]